MKRLLFLNSLSGTLLFLVNVIITFLMTPIIVRELGNRDYGIWDILLSVFGYLGILELGLGPAIVRFVAREIAFDDRERINRIAATSLWSMASVGFFGFMVISCLAFISDKIINISPGEVSHLASLFVLTGLNLGFQFLGTVFVAYLMGLQRLYFVNNFRILLYIAQAAVTYYALTSWSGSRLIWMAIILLCTNLLQYGVFAGLVMSTEKTDWRIHNFSWTTMKELYFFGFGSSLLMASDRIQRQSAPIIIAHVLGVSQVVIFSLPKRLIDYGKDMTLSMGFPLFAYFSALNGQSNKNDNLEKWNSTSLWLQMFSMAIPILIFFLGKDFLYIWISPFFANKGGWVLKLLCISLLFEGLCPNSGRYVVASGKHLRPAMIILLLSVISLPCFFLMTIKFGLIGLAVGILLNSLINVLIMFRKALSLLELSFYDHWKKTIFPLILPLLSFSAWLFAGRFFIVPSSYANIAILTSIGFMIYFLSTWNLAITPIERLKIYQVIGIKRGIQKV
jgi:O-antigen/teichoic acid export membrane protein